MSKNIVGTLRNVRFLAKGEGHGAEKVDEALATSAL